MRLFWAALLYSYMVKMMWHPIRIVSKWMQMIEVDFYRFPFCLPMVWRYLPNPFQTQCFIHAYWLFNQHVARVEYFLFALTVKASKAFVAERYFISTIINNGKRKKDKPLQREAIHSFHNPTKCDSGNWSEYILLNSEVNQYTCVSGGAASLPIATKMTLKPFVSLPNTCIV